MSHSPEHIVALVRQAGVVGAGGTGDPTDVKLQTRATVAIVNAAECEPLLHHDKAVLRAHADDIYSGLRLAMAATGASEGVIAINRSDREGIARARDAIEAARAAAQGANISVHELGDYYPSGDEMLMVYDVTGRVVPEGGSPADVGAIVLNVQTARQIYQALQGMPVTERAVTVAGAVPKPVVATVPIGTRFSELLALAGFSPGRGFTVLEGGPMRGRIVRDLSQGVSKSTGSLVVLPSDHLVARMRSQTGGEATRLALAVGGLRTQFTDLCPRHLLGHSIHPHEALVAVGYGAAEPASRVTESFLCSGCGICELIGDEASFVSPRALYAGFRERLEAAGVANPHRRSGFVVHSQYENRKLSVPLLVRKLGLLDYAQAPVARVRHAPDLVRVPIRRHVGEPAVSTVQPGARVRRGDLIAALPVEAVGALYHAPIHGRVAEVTDAFVEIHGEAS